MCLTDSLHVLVESPAQMKRPEVVLAHVEVSDTEIVVIHGSGIAQWTAYNGRRCGRVEDVACCRTEHPHGLLIVAAAVLKLALEEHCQYRLHTDSKY